VTEKQGGALSHDALAMAHTANQQYASFEELQKMTENPFDNNTSVNATVPLGDTAFLRCKVRNLGERSVSSNSGFIILRNYFKTFLRFFFIIVPWCVSNYIPHTLSMFHLITRGMAVHSEKKTFPFHESSFVQKRDQGIKLFFLILSEFVALVVMSYSTCPE